MSNIFIYTDAKTQRLDSYLSNIFSNQLSRNRLQLLIKDGCVCVNNKVIFEKKFLLKTNDTISVKIPDAVDDTPTAENITLNILFEDNDILIIDKPAGLVVHPAHGNWSGTLVNALLYHCSDSLSGIGGIKRPGIVHRLDKNTSGIMVVAKNDLAHQQLSILFADHGKNLFLVRKYYALVWGDIEKQQGTISSYICKDEKDRKKQKAITNSRPNARWAVTHYELCKKFINSDGNIIASLICCSLETGRTHQIRVHMQHIGHPVVGDPEYSKSFKSKINLLTTEAAEYLTKFNRQALHAYSLGFNHPRTKEKLIFNSPLPNDFKLLINFFENL
ncbi:RluA family pseudouridine synthase [Bartonella sp. DGB1]|uniref:RluA family pseudouridine synthase n=1 Tax=Bartonella sp. DGB1 TaxID=3239807 RepID=UPI00352653F3